VGKEEWTSRKERLLRTVVVVGAVCVAGICTSAAVAATHTLLPTGDAFVRAAEPTLNYGAAGALAVAGDSAVNGSGQPQGRFDTLMMFDTGDAVAAFDAAFGPASWVITAAELRVLEDGDPNNSIFNRGVGDFEVSWLDNDDWVEGPGVPRAPVVGSGNEITYNLLQTMVASSTEASLGTFSNTGLDEDHAYVLSVGSGGFLADLAAPGDVTLHLAPVSEAIGFTVGSLKLGAFEGPRLVLTAGPPVPAVSHWGLMIMTLLLGSAGAFVMHRRRPSIALVAAVRDSNKWSASE